MARNSNSTIRLGAFFMLLLLVLQPQAPAYALTTLSVTPLTWNVIGLDSNDPSVGPNHFPVGARVCNTGAEMATNVAATLNFVAPNSAFIGLRPGTSGTISLGTMNPGACSDAYFEVAVTRSNLAYDQRQGYSITVSGTNISGTPSTPTPRELYVEHLISQNRNGVTNVEFGTSLASLSSIAAGGTMNLMVGNTYYIRMTGFTATQGYEQIEYFINIPNTIFQILSVSSTFDADTSPTVGPSPINMLYGDNCVWENDPTSPNYRACLSTGKAGGNVTVTYQVKILQVPASPLVNPVPLSTLIYDFSGSSFHYNADYAVSTRFANIINASIGKSFSPKTITPGSNSTLTFTINNPGAATITDVNFTDDLPNNLNLADANVVYSGCGTPSPASGTLTDPMSFTNIAILGNSTCTITVTVTSNTNGTYNNTTSTLKLGTTDTGDTASDTLVVSSAPPPPTSCATRTTMATWDFENYSGLAGNTITAGDSGPFDASSDVLTNTPQGIYRSAGSSSSAIVDSDLAVPPIWTTPGAGNTTTVWGIRQSWLNPAPATPGDPGTFTSPFFEFQVNTDGLYGGLGITLDYSLVAASGWTNSGTWYVLASTNGGTTWSLVNSGSWTKGDWQVDAITATSTSTSPTVYFRLYFIGASTTQNENANAYIDNVDITGCLNTNPTPPTISKSFGANPLSVGSSTTLTFTITKTAAANLTGVSFTDVLPGGLELLSPAVSNSCGGTLTVNTTTDTVQLTGGALNAASCSIVVNVQGGASGSYTNTTTNTTSTESGPNTSTTPNVGFGQAAISVIAPPVINKSFTANPIFTGETTTLNFTITNPNPSTNLTGISFTDILPAGLDVTTASSSQCGGTLIVTDNNPLQDTISLSGGSLPFVAPGSTCTFGVTVTGNTVGLKNNSVTVSSTNGGTGNTATASVLVKNRTAAMSFAKYVGLSAAGPWLKSLNVTLPDTVYYRLVVENTGDQPLTNITVADPTVDSSTCTWNDGDNVQLSTNNAPFNLPIADTTPPINNQHYAECILGGAGGITAVDGVNTNIASADPTELSASSSQATYTGFAPNLVLAKNDGVAAVTAGGVTTYTLTVTNNGNADTSGIVTVVESPPTGITVTAISGTGWTCVLATLTCTRSDALAVGNGYPDITVSASILPTASGTLVNKARVGGGGDPTNSTAPDATTAATCTANGTPEGCAIDSNELNSLTIDKDTSTPNAVVGGTASYSIEVTNTGTTTLTGAVISDTLPAGFTYASTGVISTTGVGTTRTATSNPTLGDAVPSWGTWTIVPGGSVTIPITANVGIGVTPGTYDNTARVVTNEIPGPIDDDGTTAQDPGTPGGQDSEDDEDVTVTPRIDLSIAKTASGTTPAVGSVVTFTLTVANAGPSTATNIGVTDIIPSGYTYVAASIAGGTSRNDSNPATTGLTWTIGSLASGANTTLTYQATVLATGTYNNYAEITSATETDTDSTPGNNSTTEDDDDTLTMTPTVVIDVSLDKQVSNATPNVGSNVTFTLVIANAGPNPATNVVITDIIPGGYTYVAASIAGGDSRNDANPSTSGLTWTINSLAGGASVNLTYQATVLASGTYDNYAEITSHTETDSDSTPGDNSITEDDDDLVTVTPGSAIDVSLDKQVSNATPNVGSNVTFTLVIANAGPNPATNVVVTDIILGGYTYGAASITGGDSRNDVNPSTTGLTWTINSLASGASVNLTYQATVLASGTYDNYAEITSHTQTDSDSTPNNGSTTEDDDDTQLVTPVPVIDVSLDKQVSNSTPNIGSNVTFTLVIANAGPSTATNVVVTDVVPSGYSYVATSIAGGDSRNDANPSTTGLTWTINSLASGASINLTYQATVLASGTYDNYAEITSHTQTDSDSTPNDASTNEDDDDTQTVTPVPVIDVSLDKQISNSAPSVGSNATFTLVIANAGPSTATNIVVTDVVPGGYTYVAASIAGGDARNDSSPAGTGLTWTINSLASGASVNLTYQATVLASGTYDNYAEITSHTQTDSDSTPGNGSATEDDDDTQAVTPVPILAPAMNVIKNGVLDSTVVPPNGRADAGDVINYTIVVQNIGNASLTGVSVSDTRLTDLDCDGTPGVPFVTTGFTINVGASLTCPGSYTLTQNDLDNNGGGDGDIDNTVTASSSQTSDDTASAAVPLPLAPAIDATKVLNSATFNAPSEVRLTYTISVQNTGNVTLNAVQVTDDLVTAFPGAANFNIFSLSSVNFTVNNAFNGTTDTNLLAGTDSLAIGTGGSIILVVDVDTGGDEDNYINTTTGSGEAPDGSTVQDTAVAGAPGFVDPALTKAATPLQASVGETVTFTITVTNEGNVAAPNVVVTDTLPAMFDVTAVNVSVAGPALVPVVNVTPAIGVGPAPYTVTVTIGTLEVTNVITIQIVTTVNSLGAPPIVNTASLTTTALTDNLLNNNDSVTITLGLGPTSVLVLPVTGFAPNRITTFPSQPKDLLYAVTDVVLEIPRLGVKMPIVGVPFKKGGWDVSWLGNQAGWLEGSAFPSWAGNSVLTGHVYSANGLPGPFLNLGTLKFGDKVVIHAGGQKYVFEIRSNTVVTPNDASAFRHEEISWLTLITCKEYDPAENTYRKRVVVRAVLISVE